MDLRAINAPENMLSYSELLRSWLELGECLGGHTAPESLEHVLLKRFLVRLGRNKAVKWRYVRGEWKAVES